MYNSLMLLYSVMIHIVHSRDVIKVSVQLRQYSGYGKHWNWGSVFGRGKGFPHTSYPTLKGSSFPGCKVAKYDGDQSPPFRAEVKNE
jgi:hypothetical protein